MNLDQLLFELQAGIPLATHPYAVLGANHQVPASTILQQISHFKELGIVRRMGGVFNAIQFGYRSALCGIAVPAAELPQVAQVFANHAGVTHNYARSARPDGSLEPLVLDGVNAIPNLWFTLSVPEWEFQQELDKFQAQIPYPIRVAPATERFKVQVVLNPADLARQDANNTLDDLPFVGTETIATNPQERELIRLLQVDFPLVEEPWQVLAQKTGLSEEQVIVNLQRWKKLGGLRRVGLLARHQKMGFKANAMCVWNAPENQVKELGLRLAARKEITHCYRREPFAGFAYNLFAMVHAADMDTLKGIAHNLSETIDLPLGQLFVSAQEFKKTSLVVFG